MISFEPHIMQVECNIASNATTENIRTINKLDSHRRWASLWLISESKWRPATVAGPTHPWEWSPPQTSAILPKLSRFLSATSTQPWYQIPLFRNIKFHPVTFCRFQSEFCFLRSNCYTDLYNSRQQFVCLTCRFVDHWKKNNLYKLVVLVSRVFNIFGLIHVRLCILQSMLGMD